MTSFFERRVRFLFLESSLTIESMIVEPKKIYALIKEFKKEYDAIKAENTNLYGLLDLQHERQELIKRWFGNGKI